MGRARILVALIRSCCPDMLTRCFKHFKCGLGALPWLGWLIRKRGKLLHNRIRGERDNSHSNRKHGCNFKMNRDMERPSKTLNLAILIVTFLLTSFTSANAAPTNYSLAAASVGSSISPLVAATNRSAVSLQEDISWAISRNLAGLDFVTPGEESVTSSEEIMEGLLIIFAPIPMGLAGETALLMQRTLAIVVGVSRFSVIVSVTSSGAGSGRISPQGVEWQTFTYSYSILPPRGGSASCSNLFMAAVASDGTHLPPLLTTFQKLIESTEVTGETESSDDWTLLAGAPATNRKEVGVPRNFAGATTKAVIVFSTYSTTPFDYAPTHRCESATSPCSCASHVAGCEWIQQSQAVGRCQQGSLGVSCSLCFSQQRCAAPCSLLASACGCAASPIGCRWVVGMNQCVARGSGGRTSCSACPSQYHCSPPQLTSIIPISGTALRLPAHLTIQVNFDRKVLVTGKGSISFRCDKQPLPFPVMWKDVHLSATSDGILVSINSLLEASFKEIRTCRLIITAGAVADASGVSYLGLPDSTYFFKLGDTKEPAIVDYLPRNGKSEVTPGDPVTFFFNEQIKLVSNLAIGVLFHLDPAGDGSVIGQAVAEFRMSSPAVDVLDDRVIVYLQGVTKANSFYSIQLPGGALQDEAGNLFRGLPQGAYTFRTAYATIQGELPPSPNGGLSQLHMILLIAAGVFIVGMAALVSWRVSHLSSRKLGSVQPTNSLEASSTLRHSTTVREAGGSKERVSVVDEREEDDYFDNSTTFASTTWSWTSQTTEFAKQGFAKPANVPPDIHKQEGLKTSGRDWAQRVRTPQGTWQNGFMKAAASKKGLAGAAAAAATMNNVRDGLPGKKSAPAVSPSNRPSASNVGASHPPKADSAAKSGHRRSSASAAPSTSESPKAGKTRSSTTSSSAGQSSGGKSAADHTSQHEQKSGSSKSKASNSKPKPEPSKPEPSKPEPSKPEASTDFSGDSGETKAKKASVESKLRDMMQSPLEERKKALRELMLQYHPDKSSDPHAKEVFQFINASRGWFLAES